MTNTNRYRHPARAARGGFSLVELLVVLAIMAVLAALITAASQRTRSTQVARNSEAGVAKVQSGIDGHLKAIGNQVALDEKTTTKEFQALVAYCDGDKLRGQSLLYHCRVKQAFPQTAAELATTMTAAPLVGQPGFTVGGVNFPRSPAFAKFATITGGADEVAAVLLYAALANRTIQGTGFGSDEALQTGEFPLGGTFTAYVDGWGRPVSFRRWHRSAELETPEYANTKDPNKNPFDPGGRLAIWTPNPATKKTDAQTALGVTFTRENTLVVAFSAGPNQAYENLTGDDILGYKVRAGRKGP